MKNTICLFEDEGVVNLQPLVYLRPAYDLRCGILTLKEKVLLRFPKSNIILHCRGFLREAIHERYPDYRNVVSNSESILYLNGRLILYDSLKKIISNQKNDFILYSNNSVAAARLSKENIDKVHGFSDDFLSFDKVNDIQRIETDEKLISYPWDLVNRNGNEIENDFELLTKKKKTTNKKFKSVELINKEKYFSFSRGKIRSILGFGCK
jgi:hypothetical protein